MHTGQMALDLSLREKVSFDSFVRGHNGELLHHLNRIARGEETQATLYIWGENAAGKSHLLNACYQAAEENGQSPWFVALTELADVNGGESIFQELDDYRVYLVDDLDRIAGNMTWEEQLFQLCNHSRDAGKSLIIAATAPPANLNLGLRDLVTRLMSGLTYQVLPLAEDQKAIALKERAAARGFEISDETVRYILTHYRRDMGNLFNILDQVDKASLEQKRLITIPFLKSLDLDQ